MSAALRAEIYSALQKHLLSAQVAAGSVKDGMGPKGALADIAVRVARLGPSGDLGIQAAAGTWPHEKWAAYAQTQWEGINAQLEEIGFQTATWSRFWSEVVVATAKMVAAKAPEIPKDPVGDLKFLIGFAAVGLVALAVIRVKG